MLFFQQVKGSQAVFRSRVHIAPSSLWIAKHLARLGKKSFWRKGRIACSHGLKIKQKKCNPLLPFHFPVPAISSPSSLPISQPTRVHLLPRQKPLQDLSAQVESDQVPAFDSSTCNASLSSPPDLLRCCSSGVCLVVKERRLTGSARWCPRPEVVQTTSDEVRLWLTSRCLLESSLGSHVSSPHCCLLLPFCWSCPTQGTCPPQPKAQSPRNVHLHVRNSFTKSFKEEDSFKALCFFWRRGLWYSLIKSSSCGACLMSVLKFCTFGFHSYSFVCLNQYISK